MAHYTERYLRSDSEGTTIAPPTTPRTMHAVERRASIETSNNGTETNITWAVLGSSIGRIVLGPRGTEARLNQTGGLVASAACSGAACLDIGEIVDGPASASGITWAGIYIGDFTVRIGSKLPTGSIKPTKGRGRVAVLTSEQQYSGTLPRVRPMGRGAAWDKVVILLAIHCPEGASTSETPSTADVRVPSCYRRPRLLKYIPSRKTPRSPSATPRAYYSTP